MALQPTLPAETAPTDAERAFIELSPPGLWPENQNSNIGQIRKVLTDIIQECINEIDHLGEERFIETAVEYLYLWEQIVNLPINPIGKSDSERRASIAPRLRYGPFTRARRQEIVESFIIVTFGEAVSLTPAGIPFTSDGISLYSGIFSLEGNYEIVEDIEDFSYEVRVVSAITLDQAVLTKELERITPDGISFSFVVITPLSNNTFGGATFGSANFEGV